MGARAKSETPPEPVAAAPLVEIRDVSKHFGKGDARVDALRHVDLDLNPGVVRGLIGPCGSAKTTLLNVFG